MTGVVPKDAAAVILLRQNTDPQNPEVYWVKRSDKLAFLGGYHAFPGGQIDAGDAEVDVRNAPDAVTAAMISGAARELFEESGVLVTHGGEMLTKGQRASLLDDLESGRMSWPALLQHYELHLDANDFTYVGRWVTPPFNARRFDTWFFLVNCPAKQEPHLIAGELEDGEWITASEAYQRWLRDEVVAVPPTLHALRTIAGGLTPDLVARFLSLNNARGEIARRITFRPNYICFPVRTPTRPPATHTCCYLIHTAEEMLIVDPGSPYEDEQHALADCVAEMIAEGRRSTESWGWVFLLWGVAYSVAIAWGSWGQGLSVWGNRYAQIGSVRIGLAWPVTMILASLEQCASAIIGSTMRSPAAVIRIGLMTGTIAID